MGSWREELAHQFGWENDEAVERWLTKLRTEHYALKCLRNGLKVHCEKTGRTPTQLLEDRIEELQGKDPRIRGKAEDTVLRIYREIAENTPGTAINYFRKMKSFYKHNYCPLGCTDPGYVVKKAVMDRRVLEKLSRERIREVCERAPLEVRLAILIAAESGGRIGAIMDLTYEDVKDDLESNVIPAVIWLGHKIRLTVAKYPTFICRDAVELLEIVLKQKGKLKNTTPIFCTSKYTVQSFLSNLNSGVHAHLFRKRFQTILEDSGIPLNWVDRLLGHIPRGAQGATYSIPPVHKLREQYSRAVGKLRIYGSSEQANSMLADALAKVLTYYLKHEISAEEIAEILKSQSRMCT